MTNINSNQKGLTQQRREEILQPVGWLRTLPRWSLATALITLAIPIVFVGGIGQRVSDRVIGEQFVELLQAVRSPVIFRAAWAIDALVWLMLGGILICASGVLRRHSPIRSEFISICGIAQLLGTLGSFLRLDGVGELARYSAALPAQQVEVLGSYLTLQRVINSTNHVAVMLQGAGFLLVFWSVFSLRGFPRWLAIWFVLPGLLAIGQFSLFIAGAPYLFVLNVIGLVAGNILLNFAIAAALWRPSAQLVSAVLGEPDTSPR